MSSAPIPCEPCEPAAASVAVNQSAAQQPAWTIIDETGKAPRDRILSAAAYLFCHEGFAATGVDTIVARAGAAKTTLYKHFESKDQLIDAVLEREGAAWRRWFFGKLGELRGAPADRMLGVFGVLEIWFRDPNFYGCPFINAIAEFDTNNTRIRRAATEHKSHLISWLRATALEMGHDDPEEAARAMVVLIDGAIVAAQAGRDPTFAAVARRLAASHLCSPSVAANATANLAS